MGQTRSTPRATRPAHDTATMNRPPMEAAPAPGASTDAAEILRALQRGLGHDQVTDDNVEELIQLARERGDAQTELLLREWRSPFEDPQAPVLDVNRLPPPH